MHPHSNASNPSSKPSIALAITCGAYALLALHIVGAMYPTVATWSFSIWSVVSLGSRWTIFLLFGVALLPPVSQLIGAEILKLSRLVMRLTARLPHLVTCTLGATALFLIFYHWRSRSYVYGDGFTVLSDITADAYCKILIDQNYLQIGSVIVKRILFASVNSIISVTPETYYGVFVALGGVVGFFAVWKIVRIFATDTTTRAKLILIAMSGGSALLFFGHVEHYTWPLALSLWATYFLLLSMDDDHSVLWAYAFAVLGAALHLIVTPVLAVVIAISLWRFTRRRIPSFRTYVIIIAGGGAVFSLILTGMWQYFSPTHIFVEIIGDPKTNYHSWSWSHIRDILNLLVFCAPALAMVVGAILFGAFSAPAGRERQWLALGVLCVFLFLPAFWIDPGLGMARDWDLLGLFGIPLSLFLGIGLGCDMRSENESRSTLGACAIVVALTLAPQVYEKLDLSRSVERIDPIMWEDPHYQADYIDAYRCQPWGWVLRIKAERPDLAEKYFRRRIAADKTASMSWNHLAEMAFERREMDTAAAYFSQSLRNDPYQPRSWLFLAQSQMALGDFRNALVNIENAMKLTPTDTTVRSVYGAILMANGSFTEAEEILRSLVIYSPQNFKYRLWLGIALTNTGKWEESYQHLSWCARTDPRDIDIYESLILCQLTLGKRDEVLATMELMKKYSIPDAVLKRCQHLLETS